MSSFNVAREIKKRSPKTKIILGGSHASHTAREILEDQQSIDAIFLGESFGTIVPGTRALLADSPLEEVQGVMFRHNKKIIDNGWGPKVPLNQLPTPERSRDLHKLTKTASIMPAVGCIAACSYCSSEALRDHSWRTRSPENIAEEIEGLKREFDISTIETHCDDAFGPARQAISTYTSLAQRLISDNLGVRWRSVLRATDFGENGKLVDEDFWKLLGKSGLERLYMGFEGGTDERLRNLRKPASVDHNSRAFKFLTNLGIAVQYGFIMFFPDSTLEEIGQNNDFLYDLRNTSFCNHSSSLILLPGSEYFKKYNLEGKLTRPFYGPQPYVFSNSQVADVHEGYTRFTTEQQLIDMLCNDLRYAITKGCARTIHQDRGLNVREEFLEERAKDLHRIGREAISRPSEASGSLSEFNQYWQTKFGDYIKENATAT
ncbi:MAG: radical SAM protein [Nanoarchaeota archaeon]|nr:radical SAM protein [Nanoarchaeota archaeon]MBU1103468.1 radical SAM protein [Nanoarchaeota archaeon]